MDGKKYPYSVFYFAQSVYDGAGKKVVSPHLRERNSAFKLLLKSILML